MERRMDALDIKVSALDAKVGELAANGDLILAAIQRTEAHYKEISDKLGKETEDGNGGFLGTGLFGRMGRNERAVANMTMTFRIWIAFGTGACGTIVICWGIVWWLLGDKLATILK
jgi:hypothetical protein